jgi:two-component system, cell cycle response regulator
MVVASMLENKKNMILLIDSDIKQTEALCNRLETVGFSVLTANDEETAYKLLDISSPDLIVLDLFLNGDKGQDILTRIKAGGKSSNIPVIILSADTEVNSKVYGLLSGVNDYIVKPVHFPELLTRVNTQIRLVNMQKELEEKNKSLLENNLILKKLSITDGLSGLYNRTYIMKRALEEMSQAQRYKRPISFILADIDYFKKINDTYGHHAGDIVLKQVSKAIKEAVRDVDLVSRYGGEEFLIICPNTDVQGAYLLSERIRSTVQKSISHYKEMSISVTISLGIRSSLPKSSAKATVEVNKLLRDADVALYKAKAYGRNQSRVYEPQLNFIKENEGKTKNIVSINPMDAAERYTH